MKGFGFLINKNSAFRPPAIPNSRIDRLSQSFKRRLDDDIEEVFARAIAANDAESAADLLELMEKWHNRRQMRYGRERRISGASVQRARQDLDRLTLANASRAAAKAHRPS